VVARLVLTLASLMAAVSGSGTVQATQGSPANARTTVFVSDLHMGEGRAAGTWHPLEDFRWAPEFSAFLDALNAEGQGAVDLVLNGDTFELLPAADDSCRAGDAGCVEASARQRIDRVLAAHDVEIKALGRFANAGSNRVWFVPGDRDATLSNASLAERLLTVLGASAGRVQVAASGRWTSADGRIVSEHGHQVLNSEVIVRELFDRLEPRYPIVDNMAALGNGLRYAVAAAGGVEQSLVPPLLRAVLLITPWQQFRMELDDGEVDPPIWDLAQVRQQGISFLVASLSDDDPLKPLVVKASTAGELSMNAPSWTDDELARVCDYRAAVRRSRRRYEPVVTQFAPRGPAVAECPRTPETRGGQFDYFWQSRDRLFARHLQQVTSPPASAGRVSVFVHGHTHLADRSQTGANMISGGLLKIPMEGFSPVRGSLTPVVINGGAWQRTMTPVQYERLRAERSVADDELLRSLQPEQLAPCYGFVRIPPYTTDPAPAVRYWREANREWGFGAGCGG
jgi:hypothetical protein